MAGNWTYLKAIAAKGIMCKEGIWPYKLRNFRSGPVTGILHPGRNSDEDVVDGLSSCWVDEGLFRFLDGECVCTRCVGHTDIAVFKCGICQAKAEFYKL
jgi:hypothetical protein